MDHSILKSLVALAALSAVPAFAQDRQGTQVFASFTKTVTTAATALPDSSTSMATTIKVTEAHSAVQTLPVCQADTKLYLIWETPAPPGGYSPTFAPPAGWALRWPYGDVPPTPNTTAGLTDVYSFQCDLPNKRLINEGFAPANVPSSAPAPSLWERFRGLF